MGVGEAARDAKLIDGAVRDLATITGQKPHGAPGDQVHRAVQAARGHADRREGDPARRPDVGVPGPAADDRAARVSATSAGCRRRSSTAAATTRSGSPSSRCSTRSTTDKIDRPRGMDITVVTTATDRRRGPGAAAQARLPVQGELTRWRRRRWSSRPQRKPKFRSARYTRCQRCGRPRAVLPQVRPVPDLRAGDGARRRAARRAPRAAGSHLSASPQAHPGTTAGKQ